MVSFMLELLCPWEKNLCNILNRWLGEPHGQSEHSGEEEDLLNLTFMDLCIMIHFYKMTNKMQLYSILYCSLTAVHVLLSAPVMPSANNDTRE